MKIVSIFLSCILMIGQTEAAPTDHSACGDLAAALFRGINFLQSQGIIPNLKEQLSNAFGITDLNQLTGIVCAFAESDKLFLDKLESMGFRPKVLQALYVPLKWYVTSTYASNKRHVAPFSGGSVLFKEEEENEVIKLLKTKGLLDLPVDPAIQRIIDLCARRVGYTPDTIEIPSYDGAQKSCDEAVPRMLSAFHLPSSYYISEASGSTEIMTSNVLCDIFEADITSFEDLLPILESRSIPKLLVQLTRKAISRRRYILESFENYKAMKDDMGLKLGETEQIQYDIFHTAGEAGFFSDTLVFIA